jgi:ubiquinol-cytochrome c reductase cytochrome b subunit
MVLFGAIVTLALIPWLDTSRVRSLRFRPMLRPFFWLLVANSILLGYLGSKEPQAVWTIGGAHIELLWVARVATVYYYGFFWLILPIVGLIEHPLPLPESISKPVLGGDAGVAAAE